MSEQRASEVTNYLANMADIKTDYATGLVSAYLSDESGLTTDLHGSNTLTNNGVSLTTDLQGDAGDFERAETDYMSSGSTDFDFSTAFTFCRWWTPESNPNDQQILWDKWNGSGNNRSYRIQVDDTSDEVQVSLSDDGTGGGNVSNSNFSWAYTTGTRYWICVTYNAGTVEVLVNNVSLGTDTGAKTSIYSSSSADLFFGGRSDGSRDRDLDGIANQDLIYNTVISSGYLSWINS